MQMRKFIISVFIAGFIAGSANAEMLEFHFTANINSYSDDSGVFSELGYSDSMAIEGTVSIDTATEESFISPDPLAVGAFGWWKTGLVVFEKQGFTWIDVSTQTLLVVNNPATVDPPIPLHHETNIGTSQASLNGADIIQSVNQKVILKNGEWDVNMPMDLNLDLFSEFLVEIINTNGHRSIFRAAITSIMNAEEYAASQVEPTIEEDLGELKRKIKKLNLKKKEKNVLQKRIKKASAKYEGNTRNIKGAVSELHAFNRQLEKKISKGKLTEGEYNACKDLLDDSVAVIERMKKKK